MSFVLSQRYDHKNDRESSSLRAYGIDDKFHLDLERRYIQGGYTAIKFDISKAEAIKLRDQLNEFISKNK